MPDWTLEDKYGPLACGIDEAGRGPWAGPVAAGAVIYLNRDVDPVLLQDVNDSKKLSAKKREILYEKLLEERQKGNLLCAAALASPAEIDELNILQATFLAMKRAVQKLGVVPHHALIDGNRLPADFLCPCSCHIGGDARSFSIASASIIAKVYRDRLMRKAAEMYPGYGFEKNAGYGTKAHIEGLKKYGITPIHRKSYRPVAEICAEREKAVESGDLF